MGGLGQEVGPLAGWRGEDGARDFRGPSNPSQLERYVENGCFWRAELPPALRYYRFANPAYLEYATNAGFIGNAPTEVPQAMTSPGRSVISRESRLMMRAGGRIMSASG